MEPDPYNLSPKILQERTDNVGASTPEQDASVVESITKSLNYAPRAKEKTLPPIKALEKTKVDVSNASSKEDGSYIILQGNPNPHPKFHKRVKKNNPPEKFSPPKKPAVVPSSHVACRKAVHTADKPNKPQVNLTTLPSQTVIVTSNSNVTSVTGKRPVTTVAASSIQVRNDMMKKVTKPPSVVEHRAPDKSRHHNIVQLHSFMEQQREIRRMKDRKEQEERRLETERKKMLLAELDNKRRDLISKNRLSPKEVDPKDEHVLSLATKIYRARKAKSPGVRPSITAAPTSSSRVVINGVAAPKQRLRDNIIKRGQVDPKKIAAELRIESDAQLRTTMLLQEFENVVQRECLKLTDTSKLQTASTAEIAATRQLKICGESGKSPQTRSLLQPPPKKVSSETTAELRHRAATKIQAAFRGYKIRKIWREVSEQAFERNPRRMSFYRSRSLQPSDMPRCRLPLLSPTHSPGRTVLSLRTASESKSRTAFGIPVDLAPYIPPPHVSASASSMFGSPKPGVTNGADLSLNPFSISSRLSLGGRRRSNRFEEPFPKEALKQLALNSPKPGVSPVLSDHFLRREAPSPSTAPPAMGFAPGGISDLLNSSVPTFSMVLKEKMRLFQEMQPSSVKRSAMEFSDDRTPVKHSKRPFRPPPPTSDYDSDSTQHASIILSANPNYSSVSTTITDDYIGPDTEAMKIAYSMRKSPRLSLESLSGSETRIDSDDGTIPSSFTFSTETGRDYVTTRRRRVKGHDCLNQPETETIVKIPDGRRATPEEILVPVDLVRKPYHLDVSAQTSLKGAVKLATAPIAEPVKVPEESSLRKQVDALQDQVKTMDTNMRSTLAKLTPEVQLQLPHRPAVETVGYMLEFAKCQTESLKATAEIQQWMADMRRTSAEELREMRHQETVNIASAVYAAVAEAKEYGRRSMAGQAVQTTDSLFQNESESQASCSTEEFVETTTDVPPLTENDKVVVDHFLASASKRNTLVQRFLSSLKPGNYLEKSISRPDLNSVADSTPPVSVQTSASLPHVPAYKQDRPVITFADVLREVKLLSMLNDATKAEKTLVPRTLFATETGSEQSKTEAPISYEHDFESEVSQKSEVTEKGVQSSYSAWVESLAQEYKSKKSESILVEKSDEDMVPATELREKPHPVTVQPTENVQVDLPNSLAIDTSVLETAVSTTPDESLEESLTLHTVEKSLADRSSPKGISEKLIVEETDTSFVLTEKSEPESPSLAEPSSESQMQPTEPEKSDIGTSMEHVYETDEKSSVSVQSEIRTESTQGTKAVKEAKPDVIYERSKETFLEKVEEEVSIRSEKYSEGFCIIEEIKTQTSITEEIRTESVKISIDRPQSSLLLEENTLGQNVTSQLESQPPLTSVSGAELQDSVRGSIHVETEVEDEEMVMKLDQLTVRNSTPTSVTTLATKPEESKATSDTESSQKEGSGIEAKDFDQEVSYQSEFVSPETSISVSLQLQDQVLSVGQLEGNVDESEEEQPQSSFELEKSNKGDNVDVDEVSQPPDSVSEEKNTLDASIHSEGSDTEDLISASFDALEPESLSKADLALENTEHQEKSVTEVGVSIGQVELVESSIPEEKSETVKTVEVELGSLIPISPPSPIDTPPSPTPHMLQDMLALKAYKEKHGFPERKFCPKWSVRRRDIVDNQLAWELLHEERSWRDLSSEIAQVTETLVDSVYERAVTETVKIVEDVMGS